MSRHAWLTPNAPLGGEYIYRRLRIPNEIGFIMAVSGALLALGDDYRWEEYGDLSVDDTVSAMRDLVFDCIHSQGWSMIGSVFPYATIEPPTHCLPCDGAVYLRTDYPRLYELLAPAFILDADTFQTPYLVESFVFGASLDPVDGLYQPGAQGGETEHYLAEEELPAHTHTVDDHHHRYSTIVTNFTSTVGPVHSPVFAQEEGNADTDDTTLAIQSTGEDMPHNNMPPFMALKYAIVAE